MPGRSAGDAPTLPVVSALAVLRETSRFFPGFLSESGHAWCEHVAAHVPACARSHYVECRPGTSARVDFMSSFDSADGIGDYRAYLGEGPISDVWQRNLRLLGEWGKADSVLSSIRTLWFEYDAPEALGAWLLDASPSVALEPNYYLRHLRDVPSSAALAGSLCEATLRSLLPAALVADCWHAVERCLALLPPAGAVGYVSVMSARRPLMLKLYVVLPRIAVAEYLRRIGWPGDPRSVESVMDALYAPSVGTAYLDLSLSERVAERIGVATSQFQQRELIRAPVPEAWLRLPSSLRAEATELLRWPGRSVLQIGGISGVLDRWLDVKAVLEGGATEYKAYLGFMPRLPPAHG